MICSVNVTFHIKRIPDVFLIVFGFFCSVFLSRLWCLSSPGINERVHIALRWSHINARRLINPITQLVLPASLTFKITQTAASLVADSMRLKYC